VLTVQLVEAKGLVNKDIAILGQGKSDPYARVKVVADFQTHSFKTDVVPDNLHPVWKMVIDLAVDDPDTIEDLHIEVWDDDQVGKDDFLGRCTVPAQVIITCLH
jgi:Ca2+-dependent lipid-binding protein